MANVTVELTGDEARLLRSLDRIIAKEKELAASASETGRRSKGASEDSDKARDKAFGAAAVGQLATYAASFVSIGAVIGLVTRALGEADAARQRFTQGLQGAAAAYGRLAQLTDTPAERDRLLGAAESIYAGGRVG
ncbi:MAG TPA: hypothetical protein VMW52_00515, partial [Phycisphaerae bacterium]|nr:hypothetical protein [Phycisphaerae bacterium]